jgi:predicted ATPase
LAQNIQRALGGETRSIVKLVPAMRDVLRPDGAASIVSAAHSSVASDNFHQQSQVGSSTDTVWKQLQYSFVCFIKAIATKQRPVIMFLDDLQWSSQATMDLMTTVLSDNDLRYFLFIGVIRHEPHPHADEMMELDPQLPVSKLFQALSKFNDEEQITEAAVKCWTDITLANMTEQDLAVFLSKLLQRPSAELEDLTAKVYQSTRGNIFFTLQLLKQLQRSEVIVFNEARCQWECNWRHEMEASSKSSPQSSTFAIDVVQLITTRIRELPAELQTALAVASYTRFTFDITVLKVVLKELSERPMDGMHFLNDEAGTTTLAHLLEQAVLEGLLSNTIGGTTYRFAHDRIQQAASALIPPGEQRDKLRQRIGKSLLSMYRHAEKCDNSLSPDHQETQVDQSLLFIAADLMNSVPTKDHLFSLRLNVEVGEKSADMAALAAAAKYYEQASVALTKIRDPWKDHYDLTLHLHQKRAEVEISLSNYDIGHAIGQAVLQHSHSADDKAPVYLALADSLGRQNKLLDSLHHAKKAAQMLGEYPKRGLLGHVVKDMIWVKRYLRKTPNEKILSLPFMTDPRKLMASRLLGRMILRSMNIKEYLDMFVTILKLIRISVRHGLNRDTGLAFGLFSLLTASQNDQANALRYAKLGMIIAERTGG